jgi:hypothetical protein
MRRILLVAAFSVAVVIGAWVAHPASVAAASCSTGYSSTSATMTVIYSISGTSRTITMTAVGCVYYTHTTAYGLSLSTSSLWPRIGGPSYYNHDGFTDFWANFRLGSMPACLPPLNQPCATIYYNGYPRLRLYYDGHWTPQNSADSPGSYSNVHVVKNY